MNDQLSLTDDVRGLVRRDHRPTAQHAADAVRSGNARRRVLQAIAEASDTWRGGLTDEELTDALAMSPNTVRPRRVELVREGWVEASPLHTRPSAYGREMQVWRVTVTGRAELRSAA